MIYFISIVVLTVWLFKLHFSFIDSCNDFFFKCRWWLSDSCKPKQFPVCYTFISPRLYTGKFNCFTTANSISHFNGWTATQIKNALCVVELDLDIERIGHSAHIHFFSSPFQLQRHYMSVFKQWITSKCSPYYIQLTYWQWNMYMIPSEGCTCLL